ncbi:MAG: histidine kinase [Hungatella sp.]|nr:histidine kinase [Hungatella sp.]
MRFQKRILLHYGIILFVSVAVISVLHYQSTRKQSLSEEYSYLQTLASQMTRHLELQYSSMEEAAEALLSDPDMLDNLRILATVPGESSYRQDAEKNINIKLNTYHIVKRYYRVIAYNQLGDIFASYDFDERKVADTVPAAQEELTRQATGQKGKSVLIAPHTDPWGLKEQKKVYSLLKEVLGYKTYLEVQQTEESLEHIFSVYDEDIRVTAVFGEGKLLYGTKENIPRGYPNAELVASSYSELTGVTVMVAENKSVVFRKMSGSLWVEWGALVLFAGLFAFFLYQASKYIARPVNELREQMEKGNFENPEEQIHIENSMDEIKALANAYERVIKRLRESLLKEKSLSYLQLQAHYDLLQAQINPHFFHNVLNVISSRGLSTGDETICEMCESLAGMFRYATGNKVRYVPVRDEIGYLEQYLYLMKLRFCHKIQYSIEVEEELQTQMVPKIVFQPVVENSIKHGFNRHEDVMEIRIRGRIDREKNQWEMLFEDNGEGIDQNTIRQLEEGMAAMRRNIKDCQADNGMEIGGMGLLNAYARLILFLGDDAKLTIYGSGHGTRVVISAPVDS